VDKQKGIAMRVKDIEPRTVNGEIFGVTVTFSNATKRAYAIDSALCLSLSSQQRRYINGLKDLRTKQRG
jgi:hypothetical protein